MFVQICDMTEIFRQNHILKNSFVIEVSLEESLSQKINLKFILSQI